MRLSRTPFFAVVACLVNAAEKYLSTKAKNKNLGGALIHIFLTDIVILMLPKRSESQNLQKKQRNAYEVYSQCLSVFIYPPVTRLAPFCGT